MNGYEAMKAALYAPGLTSTEKLVLIAIADHINEAGVCWPSISRLMELTDFSRPIVIGAIRKLEGRGVVVATRSKGKSTIYKLSNLGGDTSKASLPVDEVASKASLPALVNDVYHTGKASLPEQTNNKPSEQKPEPAAAALPETDPEVGAVYAAYQDNIGSLTPHISDAISDAIDDLTASWVLAAIKLAAERNKRNWKYIAGILKSWKDQGHMDRPDEQPTANGNGEAAWQLVMSQIKAGVWTAPKDGPELAAIKRSGGWPRYKESLDRDLPFLKREFLQEYHHGGH